MLIKIETLTLSRSRRKMIKRLKSERIKPTLASVMLCRKKFNPPRITPEKKLVIIKIRRIFDSSVWALEK